MIDLIVAVKGVLIVAAALAAGFAVTTVARLANPRAGLWWLFIGLSLLLTGLVMDAAYWAQVLWSEPVRYAGVLADHWQLLSDVLLMAGATLICLVGYSALRGRAYRGIGVLFLHAVGVAAALVAGMTMTLYAVRAS